MSLGLASAVAQAADIDDTAAKAGNFKTLAAALKVEDLAKTLKGKGPFTVFAPTDEAFAKIPKADPDALLKDKAKLTAVLTNHVVPAKALAIRLFRRNGTVRPGTTYGTADAVLPTVTTLIIRRVFGIK